MINFNYENDFILPNESDLSKWISEVILSENCVEDEINFIFCDDEYLHRINVEFLNHDTFTDVISFDYSVGKRLQGDVFISTDRVAENAESFKVSFLDELQRVMVHGVLHYCGYKDKNDNDTKIMRSKENAYLALL